MSEAYNKLIKTLQTIFEMDKVDPINLRKVSTVLHLKLEFTYQKEKLGIVSPELWGLINKQNAYL